MGDLIKDYGSGVKSYLVDVLSENNIDTLSFDVVESGISLKKDNNEIAFLGLNYGLEGYFCDVMWDDLLKQGKISHSDIYNFEKATADADGKFGVIQLQAISKNSHLRQGLDYKSLLMDSLKSLEEINSLRTRFFLPGELVIWNFTKGEGYKPKDSVLKQNYDQVAKRYGFRRSENSLLYIRD